MPKFLVLIYRANYADSREIFFGILSLLFGSQIELKELSKRLIY